jgi:hypothetical protein
MAEKMALRTRETSSKNASARIIAKDSSRLKMKLRMPPAFGSGLTFQARLSAACSWTITPVEPSSTATAPRMRAAQVPPGFSRTCSTMVAIWVAPSSPMSDCIWVSTASVACSGVTNRPANTMTSTSMGASEKTV